MAGSWTKRWWGALVLACCAPQDLIRNECGEARAVIDFKEVFK